MIVFPLIATPNPAKVARMMDIAACKWSCRLSISTVYHSKIACIHIVGCICIFLLYWTPLKDNRVILQLCRTDEQRRPLRQTELRHRPKWTASSLSWHLGNTISIRKMNLMKLTIFINLDSAYLFYIYKCGFYLLFVRWGLQIVPICMKRARI